MNSFVRTLLLVGEVMRSNRRSVNTYRTQLPTARHLNDVSSELCCPGAEMDPTTGYMLWRNSANMIAI